jgi:cell division protein ZapA
MAQVTVQIDGKPYRMACDEGQEAHLERLAKRFDQYVGHLKSSFGEIGDQRLLVMSGVMVMDEIQELEKRVAALEAQIAGSQDSLAKAERKISEGGAGTERVLAKIAERLEGLAARAAATH